VLGGVFGLAAVVSIAVFAVLHFRRKRRAAEAEAAELEAQLAYGKGGAFGLPGLGREKARGSSSVGTTDGGVEMRRMAPADAKRAGGVVLPVRSRQASLDRASPETGGQDRAVSPVSDIAVDTAPPPRTVAPTTRGRPTTRPVRPASR
jgi:hypothetical protein